MEGHAVSIEARLVHYLLDGEYTAPPLALEGHVVHDEDHGWVLELVLPTAADIQGEYAVLIPLPPLHRLMGPP